LFTVTVVDGRRPFGSAACAPSFACAVRGPGGPPTARAVFIAVPIWDPARPTEDDQGRSVSYNLTQPPTTLRPMSSTKPSKLQAVLGDWRLWTNLWTERVFGNAERAVTWES
jgi:hypothetical protein